MDTSQQQPFQQPMPQPPVQQPQYQPQGIPAEVPSQKSGKVMGILSVVFGALSLIGTIFTAPIGIIFGALAISRGEKILGIIGISISIGLMIFGLVLGFIFMENEKEAAGLFPATLFLN